MKRHRLKKRYLLNLLVALFVLIIIRAITLSLFFKKPNVINLLFYGKETKFYSINFSTGKVYFIVFPNDGGIFVPGGYRVYKVGALQKLSALENNVNIIKRTFSYATGTFLDYYFIPRKVMIYNQSLGKNYHFKPLLSSFFLRSNASFLDRIYLLFFFLRKDKLSFIEINYPVRQDVIEGKVLDVNNFLKNNKGLFYNLSYRNEQKSVQIIYTKYYSSAVNIGKILEGSGIRVVDISKKENKVRGEKCVVIDGDENYSKTAVDMANFFNCSLKKGSTYISDIILIISPLEKNWEN